VSKTCKDRAMLWKLNLIPFGFTRIPMWVLAEDQALERPPIASPAATAPAVSTLPALDPVETEAAAPPRKAGAVRRIAARVFDALVRFGERSYENKRRSGRLNHYFY
jgi:hypothetical protein